MFNHEVFEYDYEVSLVVTDVNTKSKTFKTTLKFHDETF
jgi:hypothetical protein